MGSVGGRGAADGTERFGGRGNDSISSGTGSLVMLRWIIPVGGRHRSSRDVIQTAVAPALRAGGWLYGPGTTHFVEDQGTETWVTVVTRLDDAVDVQAELDALLATAPTVETTHDALLVPEADWYRAALQTVTHVGLDVLGARATIPLAEYLAFERPSDAVVDLAAFLAEVSETYRRSCSSYEHTEKFWLSFFRLGPSPELSRSGRRLWNLAG